LKDRRQFEVIESRQMDHLRVFHDVARALTSSLELEEILGAIMEKMAQFFGPERWSMMLVDEASDELYYAIAVGQDAESLKGLRVYLAEADDPAAEVPPPPSPTADRRKVRGE